MIVKIENFDRNLKSAEKCRNSNAEKIIMYSKNSLMDCNRLDTAEERIRKIKYCSKENVQYEQQKNQR